VTVAAPSNTEVFTRIWALDAAGRGPELLEHLDPDVEWLPARAAAFESEDEAVAWVSERPALP